MTLTVASINAELKKLEALSNSLEQKCDELCKRLAEFGAVRAEAAFSSAEYTGDKDYDVRVREKEGGYVVEADGESILFIEFGTGIRSGYGHPLNEKFHMGPGTWPDKHYQMVNGKRYANWESPVGWRLPRSKGGFHTYGNPPAMPMYNAAQDMRSEIEKIAKEVFRS